MSEISATGHPGSTAHVTATPPTQECRSEKCETRIHIGVFFDGTGNNQHWVENRAVNWRKGIVNWWNDKPRNTKTQLEQRCDSNVARLFRAYPDDPYEGYFPIYVPGIGTPFKEIGENEPASLGAAFGAGGDGRINFGMLSVLNAMYRAVSTGERALIQAHTIKALCSHGRTTVNPKTGRPNLSHDASFALKPVGMDTSGGLLMSAGSHASHRAKFYTEQFARLAQKIQNTPKPQLVEVFIDVFGFSRGAAEARVFCNWLDPFFSGSRLAGVTTHLRFLGLFDTVAAVGLGASATSFTDGHQDWGDAPYLRIPSRIGHCEHYVAMHENRGAFPLEDVRRDGDMPPRTRQYRFPGMHSNVGGGYSPTDQGRGPGATDSEKLSQITLNRMFDAAVKALVPLDKDLGRQQSGWDCFAIAPSLQQAYDAFVAANGNGERALKDCLMDYLAWRIAERQAYANLPATQRAASDDREDLVGANNKLIDEVAAVQAWSTIDQRIAQAKRERGPFGNAAEINKLQEQKKYLTAKASKLSRYALEIVQRATSHRALSEAEKHLFANYCHDSYAGFKLFDEPVAAGIDTPGTWETEGYLRYRTRYEGSDERLIQRPPASQPATVEVA